jgi:hypothetical protein
LATQTLSFGDSATFHIQFDDSLDACNQDWYAADDINDDVQDDEDDLLQQQYQGLLYTNNNTHSNFDCNYYDGGLDYDFEFDTIEDGIPLTSGGSIDRLTNELDDDALMILYRSFGPSD